MVAGDLFFVVFRILGGLALFIYGMQLMTAGLEAMAGARLRGLLSSMTRNRAVGFGAGTGIGFLVHSSAGTVMLVGFVNAGLLSLAASVPVMLGTNVGTTLSMQLVSFKLSKYAFAAIAVGLLLKLASRRDIVANVGLMLFGFGLLFLGMNTMSQAIVPLKEAGYFEGLLTHTDASTALGLATGILVSTLVTGIIQSSGAMVGMLFALAGAGVFTSFDNVFPLLLGAHVGTCVTALLGSLGTGIDARRVALAHLLFNLLGALLAALMAGVWLQVVPALGGDLTRQIANAHTAVQLFNALVVLAVLPLFTALVVKLSPSRAPPPQPSYLDENLLERPEAAIFAVMRELGRMTGIARVMLRRTMRGLFTQDDKPLAAAVQGEASVDLIKDAVVAYLTTLGNRRLSARQAGLIQGLMRSANDVERVGDHIETLVELTRAKADQDAWFDDESARALLGLYEQVDLALGLVVDALDPTSPDMVAAADKVLDARETYKQLSKALHARVKARVAAGEDDPYTAMLLGQYVGTYDRIVRHIRRVARVEERAGFVLMPEELDRETDRLERREPGVPVAVDSALFRTSVLQEKLRSDPEDDEPGDAEDA